MKDSSHSRDENCRKFLALSSMQSVQRYVTQFIRPLLLIPFEILYVCHQLSALVLLLPLSFLYLFFCDMVLEMEANDHFGY
jgi:hypothetical protein